MKKSKRLISIFICLVLLSSYAFLGCAPGTHHVPEYHFPWKDNGDIEIIRERICIDLRDPDLDVTDILSHAQEDGSFSNIDYYTDKRDIWHPIKHIQFLRKLQIAYNTPENKSYKDPRIKIAVTKGIRFWIEKDFHCEWNEWSNTIGIGMYLPDTLLYGVEGLTAREQEKLLKNIKSTLLYNQIVPNNVHQREVAEIGGNLTDSVIATLKIAVLEKDGNTIMWLRSLIQNELKPFPAYSWPMNRWDAEGIKWDMSFQQHWQMIYFGGYGEVSMSGMNRLIEYTDGTQFAFNTKDLDNYANFLLDGMQFATRGEGRDINASGRGVVRRDGWKGIKDELTESVELLLKIGGLKRENELKSYISNRASNNDLGADGHRYFYESDYNVYNGKKYMASVRHASNRTRIFEYLNGENPLGYYGGLGATYYYVDGDEYKDVLNVFDWNKVPGTTTRQGILPRYSVDASYGKFNNTVLVSGVSNGKIGASYTRQINHTVTSTQAYFMFEDGVVCLGNGINTWMPEEVVTSINQSRLDGDVTVCKNSNLKTLTIGQSDSGVFNFIYHDKISYITNSKLNVSLEHRTEDFKKTNEWSGSRMVSADVFELYIPHGKRPTDKSYDYTALMNTTVEDTQKYIEDPTLVTLSNNAMVQAVYDKKNNVVEAVFHAPSSLKLPDGNRLDVSVAGVLILEKIDNKYVITISSNSYHDLCTVVSIGGNSKIVTISHKPVTVVL